MATFFDRGRERAKHIVGRVSKVASVKKDSPVSQQNSFSEPAEVALGTPCNRGDLPAFKHPLDDTDTLPVHDINLSDGPRPLEGTDGDSSQFPSAAGIPFYQSPNSYCSNRFGPVPYHPWDMPLMSFVSAAKAMAPGSSEAVDAPAAPAEDHEALSESAPDTPTNHAADAPAHVEVRVSKTSPAATAAKAQNRTSSGSSKQSPPACAAAPGTAAAAAPSKISRPGVVDAATLIAPGLVAKRRAAAIAAVETQEAPSPELQASPVIETSGAGDPAHKRSDRVKLSAW